MRAAVLRALLPHQTFSMNWMLYHVRFACMQKLLAFKERQKQAILAGANG